MTSVKTLGKNKIKNFKINKTLLKKKKLTP